MLKNKLSSLIIAFSFVFLFLININFVFAENIQEKRIRLQSELAALEKEIKEQENIILNTQKKSKSLSGDIKILQAQINAKKAEIKSIDYKIQDLSNQITDKESQLDFLNEKLNNHKENLSQILKKSQNLDNINFINFIFNNNSISDYFNDSNNFISIQSAINENLSEIKNTTNKITEVKNSLEDSKDSQLALRQAQELAKQKIVSSQKEKDLLLKETKNQESIYKKELTKKQAEASKIRAALFALAGGSGAISFGDALNIANIVTKNTNTEPAFLLAILKQESNLGKNVGRCYLMNEDGYSTNISSGKVFQNGMKKTRDVQPFLNITNSLGLNAYKTQISCPIEGVAGYGGAMGPAQFIPSTWMLFDSRIKSILGASVSNPWDNMHAFTASALYLSDLGARPGDHLSMIRAACKYYGTGGSNCSYGNSVMRLRSEIQNDIDYLNKYNGHR